jgi:hypothetical protein
MLTPPTKTIRVTVPVTPEVLAIFQRYAAAGGISTGKAMGNWLHDTHDAAEFVANSMEKARSAPKLVARELHAYAMSLTEETSSLLQVVSERAAASQEAEKTARRGPASGEGPGGFAPLTPPSSNTGGKVPKHPKKTGGEK